MARLGTGKIYKIKQAILDNFYLAAETKLTERKQEIAKENREYVMQPLQQFITELPGNLFKRDAIYQLFINYNSSNKDESQRLVEIWEYDTDNERSINPYTMYEQEYLNSKKKKPTNLVAELAGKAKQLCEDVIVLRNEKKELSDYLDTTTSKYTGSLQLRKIWPTNLHKYLPVETPKDTPKKIEIASPSFINTRLATNLLENP